ncbi:ribbon-helix-helix domain-containing protein [soil metagenome]
MDTRWNIKVSEETDRRLRVYLAEEGHKRGALSHFIEQAVEEKLFELTVQRAKERNAVYPPGEVEGTVEEAVAQTRSAGRTRH